MSGISERTFLRGVALQALYEYDQSGHNVADILTYRFESVEVPNDDEKKFVIDLVTGVINNKAEIDAMIGKYAVEWPIEQIAVIDLNMDKLRSELGAVSGIGEKRLVQIMEIIQRNIAEADSKE